MKAGDRYKIQYQNGTAIYSEHLYDPAGPPLETLTYHVLEVNNSHPDEGGGTAYCKVYDTGGNKVLEGWFPANFENYARKVNLRSIMAITLDQLIQNQIAELKQAWASVQHKDGLAAVKMFIVAIDELINFVEDNYVSLPGDQKKAMVIAAVDILYDTVFAGMLPLVARPFSGLIKTFVINNAVSAAIDYFVAKYNNGNWVVNPPVGPVPAPQPAPPQS